MAYWGLPMVTPFPDKPTLFWSKHQGTWWSPESVNIVNTLTSRWDDEASLGWPPRTKNGFIWFMAMSNPPFIQWIFPLKNPPWDFQWLPLALRLLRSVRPPPLLDPAGWPPSALSPGCDFGCSAPRREKSNGAAPASVTAGVKPRGFIRG